MKNAYPRLHFKYRSFSEMFHWGILPQKNLWTLHPRRTNYLFTHIPRSTKQNSPAKEKVALQGLTNTSGVTPHEHFIDGLLVAETRQISVLVIKKDNQFHFLLALRFLSLRRRKHKKSFIFFFRQVQKLQAIIID